MDFGVGLPEFISQLFCSSAVWASHITFLSFVSLLSRILRIAVPALEEGGLSVRKYVMYSNSAECRKCQKVFAVIIVPFLWHRRNRTQYERMSLRPPQIPSLACSTNIAPCWGQALWLGRYASRSPWRAQGTGAHPSQGLWTCRLIFDFQLHLSLSV